MTNHSFFQELETLKKQFDNQQPELSVTLKDDVQNIEGYIVVWNTDIAANGPLGRCGKGGTRITPQTDIDEITMLARIMALKNAAAGLPLGGAKSGLKDDPDSVDFEQRYKKFVTLGQSYLHENGGIFGGYGFDIGGRPEHPIWACEALGSRRSFTGKPVHMGGTDYDVQGIAGLGVAVAARAYIEQTENSKAIKNKRFAVQGLGAMGAAVTRYFMGMGGQINMISDPRIGGTWRFQKTPSFELMHAIETMDFTTTTRLLPDHATQHALNDVLYEDVDILFPCAIQNVIDENTMDKICAKLIVEGANNPVTATARNYLFEQKNITTIPDFIANPGGIIAAYTEMTASETEVAQGILPAKAKMWAEEKISENVKAIIDLSKGEHVAFHHGAFYTALKRILQPTAQRKL